MIDLKITVSELYFLFSKPFQNAEIAEPGGDKISAPGETKNKELACLILLLFQKNTYRYFEIVELN